MANKTRNYLLESNLLHGEFSLEPQKHYSSYNVITELSFDDEDGLNQFFEISSKEEIVKIIREDEENFLDSKKTIMYRVD